MADVVVRGSGVSKRYGAGSDGAWALREVTLGVGAGEFVAIMGPSGCGKTTLLNLLGAMDLPSSGRVWLAGQETGVLTDDALTALRRERVGFVFQAFHLLPTLSVRENIELPLLLTGRVEGRVAAVEEIAARVEMQHKLAAFPGELSGGEAQRVAVARALVHRPGLVIADEPTGNLDSESAGVVIALLRRLSREQGAAVVMATHSAEAASAADRVLKMRDGRLQQ